MKNISYIFFLISYYILANGYVCAVGGGSETIGGWSDAPYRWIVQKSDSGKIIVLSVNTEDNWIPNYFISFGASSAYNKKIDNITIANSQDTYNELITAKAIFIKGGDQWRYIANWKNTKTFDAIRYVYNNGGVIAGTSAGAMILSDVVFTARYTSVYPDEVITNPFNSNIDLDDNGVDLIPNTIFDTHVAQRGRYFRVLGFILKSYYTLSKDIIGVGIDDQTALCIYPNLNSKVMGSGAVSFYYKDNKTVFEKDQNKYTIQDLLCYHLTNNWEFNLSTKEITYIPQSAKSFDNSLNYNYPKVSMWYSGLNDLPTNSNNVVDEFIKSENVSNLIVIVNQEYSQYIQPLLTKLNNSQVNYNLLELNSTANYDSSYTNKLINSTASILCGNNFTYFLQLIDSTKNLKNAFEYAISKNNYSICLIGNMGKVSQDYYVDNLDANSSASYRGLMTINKGINLYGDLIFQPLLFNSSDYYENRSTAVFYGMMRNRKKTGIFLNDNSYLKIDKSTKTIKYFGDMAPIFINGNSVNYFDSSVFIMGSGYKQRQIVAITNFRLNVSNIYSNYSLIENKFTSGTNIENVDYLPNNFILHQNYPNPFGMNSSDLTTKIKFEIKNRASSGEMINSQNLNQARLKIYNILGREIENNELNILQDGTFTYEWNASKYPAGVYFYELNYGKEKFAKKMLLIK